LTQHASWSIAGMMGDDNLQGQIFAVSFAGVLYFISAGRENKANNILFCKRK